MSAPASQVSHIGSTWSTCETSQVEWELVKVHVAGYSANFRAEASNLVSQHAWSGDLNGVVPIIVIVTECVCEVKNRHLRNLRRVLSNIEMSGLDGALSHGVRNKEEVKFAFNDFGLLNKACVDISTLWWVVDEVLTTWLLGLLEEPLTDSLVNDYQCDLGSFLLRFFVNIVSTKAILKSDYLVKLS